jgi:hypothetical protein
VAAVCNFLVRFASLIVWKLSCFDRVIFKGHLSISRVGRFEAWVDHVLKIRRKDYLPLDGKRLSKRLVGWAQKMCQREGRPYVFDRRVRGKDEWAMRQLRESPITEGLIAVLATLECCPTFALKPGPGRPQFYRTQIPQQVLYYYFLDARFGLMHVRVQTWAPFTIQVYVNGHDYVARQMTRLGLGFEPRDNAFVQLDDPRRAQQLADKFAKLKWPSILNAYAQKVNPLRRDVLKRENYYWVTDQAEYSTDILFRSKSALAELFTKLLEFSWLTFTPKDVLGFLGRKLHGNFTGEVMTDIKTEREPGARIKHRMKGNWLKMYDKFGLILRIETVINQPGEFKIFRECTRRDGTCHWAWRPMPKGVGNLHHYQSHALACNQRYLQALSHAADPAPAHRELANLAEPKRVHGRNSAGFNPACRKDLELFAAVLDGDHIAHGFRNKDLRRALKLSAMPDTARRTSAAISRLLKRLHVRGLIAKVPRTRRWRVTESGRQILSHTLSLYRRDWPNARNTPAAA